MTERSADPVPAPPELEPNTLASAEFARARKGFEPTEVRAMLGRASDALRAWKERDDRLTSRLAELERRLDESQELDEDRITAVLGEETARIVAAARGAATDIRAKAEDQAATLIRETEEAATSKAATLTGEAQSLRDDAAKLRDEAESDAATMRQEAATAAEATRSAAQDHADRVRAEASAEHDTLLAAAKGVLDERTTEAEATAAGIREAAQIELDAAHADGTRLRQESREAAAAEVERAREEGRSMVDEARQLRRQMLQDLAERRRTARRQIEAARAGRDRIVEALGASGDQVAAVIAELSDVDGAAQRAADAAAASVDDDIDSVVAELETGLTFGGLPLLSEGGVTESAAADEASLPAVHDAIETGDAEAEDAETQDADTVGAVEDIGAHAGDVDVSEVDPAGALQVDDAVAGGLSVVDDELASELTLAEGSSAQVSDSVEADARVAADDGAVESAGSGEDDSAAAESVEPAPVEEPSPGATVHDLFERIRAERQSELDANPSLHDDDDSDDDDDFDEEDDTDDLHDLDLTESGANGGDLAKVVVLEQPGASDPVSASDASDVPDGDSADPERIGIVSATLAEVTEVADVTAITTVASTVVGSDPAISEVVSESVVSESVVSESVVAEATVAPVAVIEHAQAAESALDRRDALLVEVEKSMSRSLKRLVSDEQNEVLDRLRRIRRGRPDTAALLPEGDDEITFTLGLHDDYAAAAAAGARFWAAESDTDEAAATEAVDADVIEGGLEIRVSELLGLRRAHLHRAVEHAVEDGVELAEFADHVRAAYREWRTRSVPELAADLAASGFALGEQAAAGEGGSWCWMVDNGGLPCSDADDNALAGAVPCGTPFPTGDVIPPAHSGCRCILVPAPR